VVRVKVHDGVLLHLAYMCIHPASAQVMVVVLVSTSCSTIDTI
jgi:hypothetical protein